MLASQQWRCPLGRRTWAGGHAARKGVSCALNVRNESIAKHRGGHKNMPQRTTAQSVHCCLHFPFIPACPSRPPLASPFPRHRTFSFVLAGEAGTAGETAVPVVAAELACCWSWRETNSRAAATMLSARRGRARSRDAMWPGQEQGRGREIRKL